MRFPSVLVLCGLISAAPVLSAQQTSSTPAQKTTSPSAQTTKAAPPPLRLESLPPEPKALTPAQQKALEARRLVNAIDTLARNQVNWGPAMSTPGYSLALIDKGHKSSPEGTQVTFSLHATGFQPGDSLTLLRWPLDSTVKQITTGLTVDASGQVICPEISQGDCLASMQPGDPVHVKEIAARGEPLRVAIVEAKTQNRAETTIIPFPIENTSGSCKLEAILGTKNAGLVLLEGSGFPQNTKIEIHIVTYSQDHPITTTTNATGGLVVAVLPAVNGHTSGTTTISYKGSSCSPSVSFPWGANSYHPL
jgi:hypothetical protein